MENQPLTPYSNRGFNAQFLSIVPYSNPLLLDGVIASIDSLRIKFTYPKCYTDLATHERHDTLVFLLDRLTDNSRWLLGQYDVKVAESRFKIGNYAYSVNFELRNDVSFTVLVGRYATPESATGYAYDKVNRYVYDAVIDFNPNKVSGTVLRDTIGILSAYAITSSVQRFDLALDFPIARDDLQLVQRPGSGYQCFIDAKGVKTEYTGKRQQHNAIKLYDKAADLGLAGFPCTRCELTLVPGKYESIKDVFPKILRTTPVELSIGFSDLPYPVQSVILHPDLYSILKATTSPNTFRKYDRQIREYGQTYLELPDDQARQIDSYVQKYLTTIKTTY